MLKKTTINSSHDKVNNIVKNILYLVISSSGNLTKEIENEILDCDDVTRGRKQLLKEPDSNQAKCSERTETSERQLLFKEPDSVRDKIYESTPTTIVPVIDISDDEEVYQNTVEENQSSDDNAEKLLKVTEIRKETFDSPDTDARLHLLTI
ncbi:hypothetical protein CDAR_209091 [Caerostris darwini]|uniref:Uncharacterized protein n=1 Tax=Caerostris darwini TaxID=1538125 RepID=A0AAV4WPL9_9ARAC|nr:hypothetical protein CDAR_209091 [Caerostris darwini]